MSMKYFHLLIMDGCASHMIVGVVAKARAIGLDLITLSSHTLHALQPLEVSCFKSFEAAYHACSYSWTLTYQGVKAWGKNLISWVARALKNTMTLENSRHVEFGHWTRMQWMKKWHYWKHFVMRSKRRLCPSRKLWISTMHMKTICHVAILLLKKKCQFLTL